VATALTCATTTQARGQEADAEALTKQGLELRRQRRDAEALDAFRRAYALKPTPRTLAQIALAEQAMGSWLSAEADLGEALQAADDPWIAPHRGALLEGLATIRSHLGSIEVIADAPHADLSVNGAPRGTLPLRKPVRVEAGSVVLEVHAQGYVPARRVAFVEPGGSAREVIHLIQLAPESAAAPTPGAELRGPSAGGAAGPSPRVPDEPAARVRPPAAPPPDAPYATPAPARPAVTRDLRARNAAYVAFAAGAVSLGLGTFYGIRTFTTKADRDKLCGPRVCTDPDGLALDGAARQMANRSTAWFAGATVAAAAGGVLLWLARERVVDGPSGTALRALSVVPDVTADRAGVQVELGGRW
jgi:hypothetical protein